MIVGMNIMSKNEQTLVDHWGGNKPCDRRFLDPVRLRCLSVHISDMEIAK